MAEVPRYGSLPSSPLPCRVMTLSVLLWLRCSNSSLFPTSPSRQKKYPTKQPPPTRPAYKDWPLLQHVKMPPCAQKTRTPPQRSLFPTPSAVPALCIVSCRCAHQCILPHKIRPSHHRLYDWLVLKTIKNARIVYSVRPAAGSSLSPRPSTRSSFSAATAAENATSTHIYRTGDGASVCVWPTERGKERERRRGIEIERENWSIKA